jgi:4-amino-4-deoxy-L-arabinose transferase-like glycosyltransferase
MRIPQIKLSERNFGIPFCVLVIGSFIYTGAQRLGSVPIPDSGDESMILQVPYELLNRGVFGWPMYRYLGGNIENVWHSLRPAYYLLMTGFFKIFGWGLTEGRAFNLIAASLVLAGVFLIGRRMFDWRVGLIAVAMLACDNSFVERSRMVRNEYLAVGFALLAFYLFDLAEARKCGWLYLASGLAAGAGVMTHTNIAYILVAIVLLMFLKSGWHMLRRLPFYCFCVGSLSVMAYEIVYDIVDYNNVRLQYRGDRAHFSRVSSSGFWQNLLDEPLRYRDWFAGSLLFPEVPRTLQHVFQGITVIGLVYLAIVCVRRFKLNRTADPGVRIIVVTLVAMTFLSIVTGRRRKYAIYMAYLTPWFAQCAGIMIRDAIDALERLRSRQLPAAARLYKPAVAVALIAFLSWVALFVRQEVKFVRAVTNPYLASFAEFADVIRSIVPAGICPASIERPVVWLAFPESDRCYVTIERRMADKIDIDGNDYALIIPTKRNPVYVKDPDEYYSLLGTMENTPYGSIRVYYTGTNPRYRGLSPGHYSFFEKWRGHVSDEEVKAAVEVWSADAASLRTDTPSVNSVATRDGLSIALPNNGASRQVELCSLDLAPNAAYQILVDATSNEPGWQLGIADLQTGQWCAQVAIPDQRGPQQIEALFRTFAGNRFKMIASALKTNSESRLTVVHITIRKVSDLALEH